MSHVGVSRVRRVARLLSQGHVRDQPSARVGTEERGCGHAMHIKKKARVFGGETARFHARAQVTRVNACTCMRIIRLAMKIGCEVGCVVGSCLTRSQPWMQLSCMMIGRTCKTRDLRGCRNIYLLSVGWDVCTLTWRHWHDNDSFKKDGKHAYRRRAKPGPRRGRHPLSSVPAVMTQVARPVSHLDCTIH
jgi:hypothetical protein